MLGLNNFFNRSPQGRIEPGLHREIGEPNAQYGIVAKTREQALQIEREIHQATNQMGLDKHISPGKILSHHTTAITHQPSVGHVLVAATDGLMYPERIDQQILPDKLVPADHYERLKAKGKFNFITGDVQYNPELRGQIQNQANAMGTKAGEQIKASVVDPYLQHVSQSTKAITETLKGINPEAAVKAVFSPPVGEVPGTQFFKSLLRRV